MRKLYDNILNCLEKASYENLKIVLKEHDAWFLTMDDEYVVPERMKVKKKKEIIDWILSTDPILEEGGLVSFIVEMQNQGLLESWQKTKSTS